MSRAKLRFEHYNNNENTKKSYKGHIDRFCQFHNIQDWDNLLQIESTKMKEMIEDYLIHFKELEKKPSYLKNISHALQNFLENNDYEGINFKKLRKIIGKIIKADVRAFTDEEVRLIRTLTKFDNRKRAMASFMSSGAIRSGALPDLRMKDLKEFPFGCLRVIAYSDDISEYYPAFVNREAKQDLNDWLQERKSKGEIITEDSLLFPTRKNPHEKCTANSISQEWHRLRKQAGINEKGVNTHAYRRRFNTIFKVQVNANNSLIERLMGHNSQAIPLDNSYFKPTEEQLFEEYCKGMIAVSTDDNEKFKVENEKLSDQIEQLNKEKESNRELSDRVKQLEKHNEQITQLLKSIQNPRIDLNGNKVDLVFDNVIEKEIEERFIEEYIS
jgi:integrase